MATSDLRIHLSETAASSLREARQEARSGEVVRFSVSPQFRHGLRLGAAAPGDVVVDADGLAIHVDADSVRRADGARIDFVPGRDGGYRIENPHEPLRVRAMPPRELKYRLDRHEPLELFDVRPADERAKARIEGGRPLDEASAYLDSLDKSTVVVFYCHRGGRAAKAAAHYLNRGFRKVYNVEGGIEGWAFSVDPTVPSY